MLRIAHGKQELELLREERVVVVQVVAEERKRLDERAAAGHDLGTAARDQVDFGEFLEDPHRVVRAQHRYRAREPDPARARRGRTEHDGRGRDGKVRPVVLADPEDVEADLLGEIDLFEQVAHPAYAVLLVQLRERVDAQLHRGKLPARIKARWGP
jgi:hypothetical protein